MKRDQKYIIGLILITIILTIVRLAQPKPIDWSENYSSTSKIPFGAYILNDLLSISFEGEEIIVNNQPIFESELDIDRSNWIFINSAFAIDEFETEILNEKVEAGDNVFISAREMAGPLADSLNIVISASFPFINPSSTSLDSLLSNPVNFTNPAIKKESNWAFPRTLTESYFIRLDTAHTTILGYSEDDQVNFIQVKRGEGSYFIHSNPFLFTNYFTRDVANYDYAFKALSYLPQRTTYWDEYYKAGRLNLASPLSYITSQRNLKWAWFIALFGMVAYLIINAKRAQRIIPVIRSPKNTSIEFATTIANLYLNNGTHKDIFEKKVLFLFEYIRSSLRVSTTDIDEQSLSDIANRSGIELEEISELFEEIEAYRQKEQLSDKELKLITERIDEFYKHSQR